MRHAGLQHKRGPADRKPSDWQNDEENRPFWGGMRKNRRANKKFQRYRAIGLSRLEEYSYLGRTGKRKKVSCKCGMDGCFKPA